jgi:hypothetical protein
VKTPFELSHFISSAPACNMLLEGISDVYTLRNYGKSMNCSLASLYPARVTVLSLSVGMTNTKRDMELETGTIHKVSNCYFFICMYDVIYAAEIALRNINKLPFATKKKRDDRIQNGCFSSFEK